MYNRQTLYSYPGAWNLGDEPILTVSGGGGASGTGSGGGFFREGDQDVERAVGPLPGGTTIRAFLTALEAVSAPPPAASPPAAPPGAPAIVVGGSEDSRLLLRGLLRLHRHRVLLEGPTHEGIDRLPPTPESKVLVLDAGTGKGDSWLTELSASLAGRSDLFAIVILPSADAALEARARQAGAKAILVRPFAIRDFIQAVNSVGTPSPSP